VIANRYRLLEHLGGGAMGDVFIAENLAIRRRVAVKVLKPELLADAEFRRRFQVEVDALAAIDHRNVARFFDCVVDDRAFLVLEYVPGPTLAEVLAKEGSLDVTRALNVARRLAWGLEAAHKAGVIHRDVKPANVILARDPELGEEPKIIDFGLAKLVRARDAALTKHGQIVGTPRYMAPEQIAGGDVDARADVYALACLLFHLVAGRPPFDSDDDMQVLYQQVHATPPTVASLRPGVPPALDAVLARALGKLPDERYASMADFAAALGTIDRRRATERAQPGVWRHPRAAVAIAAGLAAMAGAVGGFVAGRSTGAGATGASVGAAAAAAIARDATLLVVSTRPAGASVELDGAPVAEKTPVVLSVAPGRHVVRVAAGGRAPVEQVATVEAGARELLDVALPPASRTVRVESVPGAAQLFVDGRLMQGQTPLDVPLTEDDFHELRFEKAGFVTARRAIAPDDRAATVVVQLEPDQQQRATVWIDADRSAAVFVDGAATGLTTPTMGIRMRPGRHLIELRDDRGRRGATAEVTLARGETRHLRLDFAARGGRR